MKKEKTPFNEFYSGHTLLEYPSYRERKPADYGNVGKGDDGYLSFKDITYYPGGLREYTHFTGKA